MNFRHAEHRRNLIQIHVAVLLAGGTGLFPKFLSVSPMATACARTMFGAATLLVLARVFGISLHPGNARALLTFLISGAILAFHWFTFFQSIRVSTVAIGVLGFGSMALFSTFLEPMVFRERLRSVDVAIGALVVAGLLLITPEFDVTNAHTRGLLWGIASGFLYSVFFLITRSLVRKMPAVTVAMYQQAFAVVVLLPFAWSPLGSTSWRDWAILILLGVVFTGVMQWLIASSLRHLSVQTNSVLLTLEPVYAILLAWFLLNEKPDFRTVIGGIVICGAVLWISLRPRKHA